MSCSGCVESCTEVVVFWTASMYILLLGIEQTNKIHDSMYLFLRSYVE